MVGFLSVVLFVVAAFAVDFGQTYVAKRDTQTTVDFAALAGAGAGGANLPATSSGTCWYGAKAAASQQAIIDTAAYLGERQAWSGTVTPASLVDCDLANGEAAYGRFVSDASGFHLVSKNTQLSVIAPQRHVNFQFGRVADVSGIDVNAQATVEIKSPKIRTLPFYAFSNCDYGIQTIAQPTNGHSADIVLLSHPSETNAATFTPSTATNPNPATNPFSNPASVPLDVTDPNDIITINGTNLGSVTDVGFFESGVVSSGPEPVTVAIGATLSHTGTQIRLHLPSQVASTQTVWYIRVKIGTSWSQATHTSGSDTILDALPLQVGSPTLTCGQGSNAGNFGTLKLPNSAGPSGQSQNIAYNIAVGLEHPVAPYPSTPATPAPSLCTTAAMASQRLLWPHDPTNCVPTKTGLDLDAAQMGFLDGVGGKPGRLQNTTDGGCAASGQPATTATLYTEGGAAITQSYQINNDTLSCFFTDDTTNIGDIASASYSGGPVLSQRIYDSARFALVPVFAVQPSNGGSDLYTIIDMRPAFITDQSMTATHDTMLAPGSHNGITLSNNGQHYIGSVQIVFFNLGALPPPPSGLDLIDWTGTGLKQVALVD
jgi:hypothetical protein